MKGGNASEQLRMLFSSADPKEDNKQKSSMESLDQAREVYKRLLSRFIGSYTIRDIALVKMSDEGKTNPTYTQLVNDPSIKVRKEETHFSVEETREGGPDGGSTKTPCYTVAITYDKVEIEKAFDRMEKFLEELIETKPPIKNASVLNDLMKSWEFFISEVPPTNMQGYYAVADKLKESHKIIKQRELDANPVETVEDILDPPRIIRTVSDSIPADNGDIKKTDKDGEAGKKVTTIIKKKGSKPVLSDPELPEEDASLLNKEGFGEDVGEVLEGTKFQTDPAIDPDTPLPSEKPKTKSKVPKPKVSPNKKEK